MKQQITLREKLLYFISHPMLFLKYRHRFIIGYYRYITTYHDGQPPRYGYLRIYRVDDKYVLESFSDPEHAKDSFNSNCHSTSFDFTDYNTLELSYTVLKYKSKQLIAKKKGTGSIHISRRNFFDIPIQMVEEFTSTTTLSKSYTGSKKSSLGKVDNGICIYDRISTEDYQIAYKQTQYLGLELHLLNPKTSPKLPALLMKQPNYILGLST
ncbi:hypothetical protein CAP35_04735 [Chitinophagaceae bacterium IBVUCB1]|nr:hypothetical protein CAP35_04735 [Chitinophagaceae bacterium IBVUCB1]